MWVAKDKDGEVHLFYIKPHRDTVFGSNSWTIDVPEEIKEYTKGWDHYDAIIGYWMKVDAEKYPNLKWEDEPLEIELVPKNDNAIVPKMLNAVQEKLAESVDDYFNYVGHVQDIHPYSKEQEQNYYNDMCWRWQDWDAIKYDHPSTWDLNFDDYVDSKR